MKTLINKVAIVTGAAMGIGLSIARLFASEGASVVISDINEPAALDSLAEMKNAGWDCAFVKADTSNPQDQANLVRQTVAQFGGLDLVCNNAGIGGELAPTADYPIEGWNKVININLSGVFYGMRYQIPALLARGGGTIVNISSILGQVGTRNSPAYVAAKHGVIGLTKAAALEYARQNVRINVVGPGYIRTPLLTNALDESDLATLATLHPLGRLGNPEEVAELVLWLSSEKASFVTGSYFPVDGGYLAQ